MSKKLFNYLIGNPPFQEDTKDTSDKPVYNYIIDAAYNVAEKVELIHPARFLFNAGKTPKAWNEKMLNDPHLKVLFYEQVSGNVFPNTDIKGGVAITYRDEEKNFGPIEVFTHYEELRTIKEKVVRNEDYYLDSWVYAPESYKLTDKLHYDFPNIEKMLSSGHKYDVTTNIFEKLDRIVFFDEKDDDSIGMFGLLKGSRCLKYIKREYIKAPDNFEMWKVFLPKSNGSGAIGEVLSTPLVGEPLVGEPLVGHTQSFISIGSLNTEQEAQALLKYIKTKFARTMLGILKITQDNKRAVWRYVPLQDFTESSDIDWSKGVGEIDLQLYRKYGLDEREVEFIETHVKEME